MAPSRVSRKRSHRQVRKLPSTVIREWLRREDLPWLGGLAVGTVVLLWLAWQIIGNTIADTTSRSDPRYALEWRADDAAALVTLADQAISTQQAVSPAADLARKALVSNPLEEGALRVLATAADRAGQGDQANKLMTLAADRSLRDTRALVWLFDKRIEENDPLDAVRYADAILRTRPDLEPYLGDPLVTIAGLSGLRPALIKVLGEAPPWRGWFLAELAAKASEPTTTYAVLAGLSATANPPHDDELKPYLDRLIGQQQYQLAFLTWLHFLPPAIAKSVPFVFDGDFERPVAGSPFDWMISPIRGATTEIVATGDQRLGHALRVVFADTRVPYRQVSKLLILPPGTYEFSGLVKTDHLVNERGVVWRLFCAEGDSAELTATSLMLGTSDWHRFATRFTVPSTGCAAQWLRLELAARFPIEEQVSGAIWFDNLAIRWADATDAATAGH